MRLYLLLIYLFLSGTLLVAQTGIMLNTEEALESYTLIENGNATFLINNCGEVLNQWNVNQSQLHPKLLPNGNLLFIAFNSIRELDWDGALVKLLNHNDPNLELVYEVIPLANGNYLSLGRRFIAQEEFIAIGYAYGFPGVGFPSVVDVVVELDGESGDLVWEWNISEHVIQQRDPNAANFGSLSESPELLNMDAIATYDWETYESFMINGMDYNPTLDQIALSVRKISEMVIIDHSTTTEEAAGHTGGNSGKGGDILYRWGNPQNYLRGDFNDRMLYFQHNPNWITEGEHAGKLIMYNNGLTRPDVTFENRYSDAPIIDPPMDINGNYILEEGEAYGPIAPDFRLSAPETGSQFYSSYTSGAEVLPNGNIYITEGIEGRLVEFNTDGEMVWAYTVPDVWYIFRSEKYPLDYPAFTDRELIPGGPIPGDFSTYDCMLLTSNEEVFSTDQLFRADYLAATRQIRLENTEGQGFQYALYNLQGQLLRSGETQLSSYNLKTNQLAAGLYLVQLSNTNNLNFTTFKIMIND